MAVKPGVLYMALISGVEDAYYSIKWNFYLSKKSIPQLKIDAGNDGIVDADRIDKNLAIIKFKPVFCTGCT